MAEKATDTGKFTYLKVDLEGNLYRKAPEGAKVEDGYYEYHYTFQGEKNVRLQENFSSTHKGKISRLGIRETSFGDRFIISIDNGKGEIDVIEFNPYTTKGNYTGMASNIIRTLPNLDYSEEYKVRAFATKNDDGSSNTYLSISKDGTKETIVETAVPTTDLPQPAVKQEKGKDVKDYTERDNFIYKLLTKEVARWEESQGLPTPPNVASTTQLEGTSKVTPSSTEDNPFSEVDDDDDVSF